MGKSQPSSGPHGPDTRQARRLARQRFLAALILAFVTLAVLTTILAGCSSSSKPGTARAATQTVVPVGVATAKLRDVPVYLRAWAT